MKEKTLIGWMEYIRNLSDGKHGHSLDDSEQQAINQVLKNLGPSFEGCVNESSSERGIIEVEVENCIKSVRTAIGNRSFEEALSLARVLYESLSILFGPKDVLVIRSIGLIHECNVAERVFLQSRYFADLGLDQSGKRFKPENIPFNNQTENSQANRDGNTSMGAESLEDLFKEHFKRNRIERTDQFE